MKKLKVYLDTTIINFAIYDKSSEKKDLTLKLIEDIKSGKYEAFISDVVLLEINAAPEDIALKLRDIVKEISPEELDLDEEARDLADKYIEEGITPEKYRDDALHIAIASANDLDVIISWNFQHIVKLKTKREVLGVNALMGYKEIDIYSPLEVVDNA